MAGMYPDNKEITIYGEEASYPGVGVNGKYTEGNFDDPLVPPSRLDPKTINLIIDNLNSLIKSMELEPNNTGLEQLSFLFTSLAEAHRGIKRDEHGRAKVKSPLAENDIAIKANVTAEARVRATEDNSLQTAIDTLLPVGMIIASASPSVSGFLPANGNENILRVDYPRLNAHYAALLPAYPYGDGNGSTTFGLPPFNSEGAFLRGFGGLASAIGIEQQDAMRNLKGSALFAYAFPDGASGVFVKVGEVVSNRSNPGTYAGSYGVTFDASRQVLTASEFRPKNQSIYYHIKY